jgi:ABC-type transporter Mla subunit MlaD
MSSGPCIETGEFADNAESVMGSLQGVIAALKAGDVDKARTAATTASSGLRKLADFVEPAQPEAAKDFRTAASELDSASTQFPDGAPVVEQAQADVNHGLLLAGAAKCAS